MFTKEKKTKEQKLEAVADIFCSVPFGTVAKLTVKLLKYSKGGITKAEGEELLKDLTELVIELTGKLHTCEDK